MEEERDMTAKRKLLDEYLPGEHSPKAFLEQMLRVNHAGEYGAKRIYEGQLAVLKGKACEETIRHMAEQEEEHLKKFEELLVEREVRPTALLPLWHIAGFALGAGTALLGEKGAMACTVAVEETIDKHYEEQAEQLAQSDETDLRETIEKFREEELEHRDIGLSHDAPDLPGYHLLYHFIETSSKAAIWLSKRI